MAKEEREFSAGARWLMGMAAFVIVAAGMRLSKDLIAPFLLSAFIAIISAPPLLWMRRKGAPSWLAMLLVGGTIFLGGFLVALLIGKSVADFNDSITQYQASLQQQMSGVFAWLQDRDIQFDEQRIRSLINPGAVMGTISTVLTSLGGMLANGFMILLTVIFMLAEASSFPVKFQAGLGGGESPGGRIETITGEINRYMALKTIVSLATGVIIYLLLLAIGVDYPLLWGVLSFLLNYVPNIGSIIAAVPPVLLALVQFGPGHALWTAIGFIVTNVVMGNVVEPRMMGRGLGLSTLVVFVSLVFWGWILGPVGMLLSVPLTMTLKIALDANDDTRWAAIMLGDESTARAIVGRIAQKQPPVKNAKAK